ncbi:MAG: hypothetical protein MZV63_45655 [Marinilabiliales bacterium]|nr:hypothetical protein [Marinilabiliales bacterium]
MEGSSVKMSMSGCQSLLKITTASAPALSRSANEPQGIGIVGAKLHCYGNINRGLHLAQGLDIASFLLLTLSFPAFIRKRVEFSSRPLDACGSCLNGIFYPHLITECVEAGK